MVNFISLIFIFCIGQTVGWCIEFAYRNLTDKNKVFVNPGFCLGPWLPIYGFGSIISFFIANLEPYLHYSIVINRLIIFIAISFCATMLELIGGELILKIYNLRFWDYQNEFLNYKGFICLKFSVIWMIFAAIYYFFIHEHYVIAIIWLSNNLAFSFFIGCVFTLFIVDVIYSGNIISKIKELAIKESLVFKYAELKNYILNEQRKYDAKWTFYISSFRDNLNIVDYFKKFIKSNKNLINVIKGKNKIKKLEKNKKIKKNKKNKK